jgi:hypothetical protein
MHFSYSYGTLNNGNVQQITNNLDNNRTQIFSYDGLNRLRAAWSYGNIWGNGYIYDGWGNLTNMEPIVGKTNYWPLNKAPASNKNQLGGDAHDAAGNLWNSGVYTWDAENRLATGGGATFTYDGDGERVKKSSGTLYWSGTGSDSLVESNVSGAAQNSYIFFGGKRVAKVSSTGTVNYYFADHLGTSRKITSSTGSVLRRRLLSVRFGAERVAKHLSAEL